MLLFSASFHFQKSIIKTEILFSQTENHIIYIWMSSLLISVWFNKMKFAWNVNYMIFDICHYRIFFVTLILLQMLNIALFGQLFINNCFFFRYFDTNLFFGIRLASIWCSSKRFFFLLIFFIYFCLFSFFTLNENAYNLIYVALPRKKSLLLTFFIILSTTYRLFSFIFCSSAAL